MKYLHEISSRNEKKYIVISLCFHIVMISIIYFKFYSNTDIINQSAPESSLSDVGLISDTNSSNNQERLNNEHEKELIRLEKEKLNANAVSAVDVDKAVKDFKDNIKKEENKQIAEKLKIENEKKESIIKEKKIQQEKKELEKSAIEQRNKKQQELKNKKEQELKDKKEDELKKQKIEKIKKAEELKRQKSMEAMKKASIERQNAERQRRMNQQNRGYNSQSKSLSNNEKMALLKLYRDQMYNKVYSNWFRPSYSKKGWSCKAIINQSRNGTVNSVKIIQCQGDSLFQDSVKKAIYKSSPLPLPKDDSLFNDTIEITFKVT